MLPAFLKSHDHIALVCPGNRCLSPEHPPLTSTYLHQRYQLHAHFSAETTARGFTPQARADFFLNYLFDERIKLIAALRGGEGCADILPYLHQHRDRIKTLPPKWLLGFSDFTAILVYFAQHYQWPAIHGANPLQFALQTVDANSEQAAMRLLMNTSQSTPMKQSVLSTLVPLNIAARQSTGLEAELTGGCLSVLSISIKDIWEIDMKDKIIFLEDVGEKAHKILRTLKYFDRIGLFAQARAIIFGDFTSTPIGRDKIEQQHNQQTIADILKSFATHHPQLPVLHTTEFGHGQSNLPLGYNIPYRLQLGEHPTLSLCDPYMTVPTGMRQHH